MYDPVSAAIFFNEIVDSFTKHLLGYEKEDGGIFGHVSGYYGMTEEQGTGTLHNHMLVWIRGFEGASSLYNSSYGAQSRLPNSARRMKTCLITCSVYCVPDIVGVGLDGGGGVDGDEDDKTKRHNARSNQAPWLVSCS